MDTHAFHPTSMDMDAPEDASEGIAHPVLAYLAVWLFAALAAGACVVLESTLLR